MLECLNEGHISLPQAGMKYNDISLAQPADMLGTWNSELGTSF
jgi:hypothetical protein